MKLPNHSSYKLTELVFENRNRNYGAYQLRTEYHESLIKSFLLVLLSIALFSFLFYAANRKNSENPLLPVKQLKEHSNLVLEIDLSQLMKAKATPAQKSEKAAGQAATTSNNVRPIVKNEIQEHPVVAPVSSTTSAVSDPSLTTTTSNNELPGSISNSSNSNAAIMELSELDSEPEFPGGINSLMKFLGQHIVYPARLKANGKSGTVYASFQINKYGEVSAVKIIKGLEAEFDAEVIRVISNFPKWKPGMYRGEAVAVQFRIPVRFELRN